MDHLDEDIIDMVRCDPSLTKLQLCRWVNGQTMEECTLCDYYANPRKRSNGWTFSPDGCDHKYPKIKYRVKKLGLITTKTKIEDHYQARGWDWGYVLSLPEGVF